MRLPRLNRRKYLILAGCGGILLLVAFILYRLWLPHLSHSEIRQKEEKLGEIFRQLDSDFWKNPAEGLSLAGKAIELSLDIKDTNSLVKAYSKKASCYQLLDSSDLALTYYSKGLEMATLTRNDSLIAKTRNGIANYYLRREQYPQAIQYLTQALVAAEKVNYKHCTGLIYNGLGLVNISLKDFDKAIQYFQKANAICREIKDYSNEAGTYLNIANCYAEIRNYAKARQYYLNNLDVLLHLKDTSQIVLAYINLGIVDRSLGMLAESFRNLEKAAVLLETYKNQSLLSTTLLETGTSYLESEQYAQARKYLEKSLETAEGTLSKSNAMEALQRLSILEEKEGRIQQALTYYKKYTVLKDSVMNDETRKSVAEIQLKYDVQKKVFENEILSKKYEIKKRQNLMLLLLFVSFLIFVILIGILIWLSHKSLRKSFKLQELENEYLQEKIITDERINQLEKARHQAEIDAKNKELTTTSLQLVNKNKILTDISRKTEEFYKAKSIDGSSYQGLQKIVQENFNIDKEWEQFKDLFEKVHQNFFTGLKSRYPELTESELRLCAYLRINLQNKEIARIINVSPATVTTSRYRIRKKLQLDNKTVLEDFLRNF